MQVDENVNLALQTDNETFSAKIPVPGDLNFTEIKILAFLNNPEEVDGALNLLVNVGDNVARPTATSFEFKGESIWSDGIGVFLDSSKVKPNQDIQILVTGAKDMQIMVTCFSIRENSRDIMLGQKLYDDVSKDKTKMYVMDLSNTLLLDEADIYVKLTQYSGRSKILVSPDTSFKENSVIKG